MVVLDEDGKPCKTCNTLSDFQQAMFGESFPTSRPPMNLATSSAASNADPYKQEPPDSVELGQNTWMWLHSMAAHFPKSPTSTEQSQVKQLITNFALFYPCKPCAVDFQEYLRANEVDASSRDNLSWWMCNAHNAVNKKLGKKEFDCRYWKQRWREGWDDFMRSQR